MQAFAENFHNELFNACRDREIVCVDGKAERGTVQENGRSPDIVSAYSFNTGTTTRLYFILNEKAVSRK